MEGGDSIYWRNSYLSDGVWGLVDDQDSSMKTRKGETDFFIIIGVAGFTGRPFRPGHLVKEIGNIPVARWLS